jgi:hypothetical protein
VPIVSASVGHAKPSITLDIFSRLLGGEDNDPSNQAEAILLRVLNSWHRKGRDERLRTVKIPLPYLPKMPEIRTMRDNQ